MSKSQHPTALRAVNLHRIECEILATAIEAEARRMGTKYGPETFTLMMTRAAEIRAAAR